MTRLLGLYRETSHSPGRVDDDAAIMDAVGAALGPRGFTVELRIAAPAVAVSAHDYAGIFAMCEQDAMLRRLEQAEQDGTPVINSPVAIRNTYRVRTASLFANAGVASPQYWVVDTAAAVSQPLPAVWVKRADFHATEADDVMFADSQDTWRAALASFSSRGLGEAVIQAHVPGDLVKFYGVIGCPGQVDWFHWFYHRNQQLANHVFSQVRLQHEAFAAAKALGLEVFGGDAIVDADGGIWIIDLNAWPSFARCRDAAAQAIAGRLAYHFAPFATTRARLSLTR